MIKRLLLILVLTSCDKISEGQCRTNLPVNTPCETTYSVIKNGKPIGWLRVRRQVTGKSMVFSMESSMDINILGTHQFKSMAINRFLDQQLQEAISRRWLNGKSRTNNHVELGPTGYQVLKGKATGSLPRKISSTVTSLYFSEPIQTSEVFSEIYLRHIPVKKTEHSIYETPLPDGGKMTYRYENHMLKEVTADTRYGTVRFICVQGDH